MFAYIFIGEGSVGGCLSLWRLKLRMYSWVDVDDVEQPLVPRLATRTANVTINPRLANRVKVQAEAFGCYD